VRLVSEGVSVTLPVDGRSMLPFIVGGRESVILQQPAELKVGDVVLALAGGRYVVHRIISINGDNITLMGDGNLVGTESCTVADVKAKATHVVDAHEQMHYLYTPMRRLGAKVWWKMRAVRRYLLYLVKVKK
jgi:hypothetical protein